MRMSSVIAGLTSTLAPTLAVTLTLALSSGPVLAEGLQLTPVGHAATVKECGACHLVFPPQMLPMRSWKAITDNLANHFGEDASLPQNVQFEIADYLMSMAADSLTNDEGKVFMRGIAANETPLRITDTPIWQRIHGDPGQTIFKRADIKSAANCKVCHQTADKGEYLGD